MNSNIKTMKQFFIQSYVPLLAFILMAPVSSLTAQSKKELQAQVADLKSELADTKAELTQSKKNEAVSSARVSAIEAELTDVRNTNATLLANLNRITEESSKKTASISESLTNIQRTERQLRSISDGLTSNDSTTLAILTALKKTMGEDARLGVSNNAVTVAIDNQSLFGPDDKAYQIDTTATAVLRKVADILKSYPEMQLQIDSYANALELGKGAPADNLELSALRATAIARKMSSELAVKESRITASGKGIEGLSLETSTHFIFRPDYAAFYKSLKESIKN